MTSLFQLSPLKRWLFATAFMGATVPFITNAATFPTVSTPTLELFPISVKEQIRQTSEAAKSIETNIQGIISKMDAQHELYKASKCDAVDTDAGCDAIKRNINQSFIEMLTQVEASLPKVESAMSKIKQGMEKSLRNKIGMGMSPRELQAHIAGKRTTTEKNNPMQKRTANLSSVFSKYYQLISTNRDGSSIPTMAAGVYLDSLKTLEFTAMIKQEIAIAKVEAELRDIYSDVTPQMMVTVAGVKSLLFGAPTDEHIAPAEIEPLLSDPNIAELQIDL